MWVKRSCFHCGMFGTLYSLWLFVYNTFNLTLFMSDYYIKYILFYVFKNCHFQTNHSIVLHRDLLF